MSIFHSTSLSLSLKDSNIAFSKDHPTKENLRGLSYNPPTVCPICSSIHPNSIIKYDFKSSLILLPDLFRT